MQDVDMGTQPASVGFKLSDEGYAAMADTLCEVPCYLKGVSDTPTLNAALGQVADQLSFALMESHAYAGHDSPDERAGDILDTGRAILFEQTDGTLRFGIDAANSTVRFEASTDNAAADGHYITVAPEVSGQRDLALHDVNAVMCNVTPTTATLSNVAAAMLELRRDGEAILLGVRVTDHDDPETPLSIVDLKQKLLH